MKKQYIQPTLRDHKIKMNNVMFSPSKFDSNSASGNNGSVNGSISDITQGGDDDEGAAKGGFLDYSWE